MAQNKTPYKEMKVTKLFDEAEKNSGRILGKFQQACKNNSHLDSFANEVEKNSRVSVNRTQDVVRQFIAEPDPGLMSAPQSKNPGETFIEFLLRVWPGAPRWYHRRREEFRVTFEDGDMHLFGALNAGGAGTAARQGAYGHYCIVIKEDFLSNHSRVAYCKYDSLDRHKYWTCDKHSGNCEYCPARKSDRKDGDNIGDQDVKEFFCRPSKKLLRDYAAHSHRGPFASLKHKSEITAETMPANVLIQYKMDGEGKELRDETEEYIEACFIGPLPLKKVEEVRFHPGMATRFLDEATWPVEKPENDPEASLGSYLRPHFEIIGMLQYHRIKSGFG